MDGEWPVDWFTIWLRGRRFRRGLSVGCGAGEFERDLARHKLCERLDAFDASVASVRLASQAATSEEHRGLHYFVADFNRCRLPRRTYDAVFFHQSLHHVENLEGLLREVLDCLRPGGLLYLDEYIGPSRSTWSDDLLIAHRAAFAQIPEKAKVTPSLPLPIQEDDPSEAIRSDEIMGAVRVGFRIAAARGYGGNILSVLYPNLRPEELTDAMVSGLIALDREQVVRDERSYYSVIVARPKRGIARWLASRKYERLEKKRGAATLSS